MQFSQDGLLVGAAIQTYLLEKVRLTTKMPGERNYHIFYEILKGANEDKEMLFLEDLEAEDFKITSKSGTYDRRDGVEDEDEFDNCVKAFETLGFDAEEEDNILKLTSAMLHASNLTFSAICEDESQLDLENDSLSPVLTLLGFDQSAFRDALCCFYLKIGSERHRRSLKKSDAELALLSLITATYSALFCIW